MLAPRPIDGPTLPTGTVWECRARTDDVDQHARAQPGWGLHYEQLSCGRFEGLVHHLMLPLMRLVHERCNTAVRQTGHLAPGSFGFAMALETAEPAIYNGQRVEGDDVMLGRLGELDLCTPAPYALIGVVVDATLLVPLWERLYGRPPSAWIESQLVVPARPALAQALRACHLKALDDGSMLLASQGQRMDDAAERMLRDALLIEWLELLPPSIDASGLPTALARKQLVDKACTLMLEQPDEPVSLLEVCRRVGASRRKLNYCFQETLGTPPVKYLRAVRLNGVRRELRQATGSVQDVAARWGFWHLGQFSRDYRQQFGELPSQTLRGRRA